jgi:hypothetical protein
MHTSEDSESLGRVREASETERKETRSSLAVYSTAAQLSIFRRRQGISFIDLHCKVEL